VFGVLQRFICRVYFCAESPALGKRARYREQDFAECGTWQRPDRKHWAKRRALGKEPDSGSDLGVRIYVTAVAEVVPWLAASPLGFGTRAVGRGLMWLPGPWLAAGMMLLATGAAERGPMLLTGLAVAGCWGCYDCRARREGSQLQRVQVTKQDG
jgi:hypothetical protein